MNLQMKVALHKKEKNGHAKSAAVVVTKVNDILFIPNQGQLIANQFGQR
jgi:hypothetical protein